MLDASAAKLFKAFSDPNRLRLLALLKSGEKCVCDLENFLKAPQPRISRHLGALRRAGLVEQRQSGRWRHYRLAAPAGSLHRKLLACVDAAPLTRSKC